MSTGPTEWDRRHVAEYHQRMAELTAELATLVAGALDVGSLNSTGTPSEAADPWMSESEQAHASAVADDRAARAGDEAQRAVDARARLAGSFARLTRVHGGAT